jgi:hypothetical protein
MAGRLGVNSLNNNVNIYYLDADPSSDGIGFPATIGSIAIFTDSNGEGRQSIKVGAGDVQWVTPNPYFGVGYEQQSELGEESTTSTSYVDKFIATFTAPITATYIFFSYYDIRSGSPNSNKFAQGSDSYRVNGGTYIEFGNHSHTFNRYQAAASFSTVDLTVGDTLDVRIQFRRSGNATAFMKRNKVIFYAEGMI